MRNLKEAYYNIIDSIKKQKEVMNIFLVGSSKNLDFNKEDINVNDIDLFIICNQVENQIRTIKRVNNISFDLNYFSLEYVYELIESKEYFFIKEMKDAKTLLDINKNASKIISMSKEKYQLGPNKLTIEEKDNIKENILSKIYELKYTSKFDNIEYEFLTNLCLRDIIVAYFKLNDKWLPKEKKLLKELKNENINLYSKIKDVELTYNTLNDITKYILR